MEVTGGYNTMAQTTCDMEVTGEYNIMAIFDLEDNSETDIRCRETYSNYLLSQLIPPILDLY